MTDKEKIRTGESAKRLLNDPVLMSVLEEIRADVIKEMESTDQLAVDEMTELYRLLRTVKRFEQKFKKLINSGIKAESATTN